MSKTCFLFLLGLAIGLASCGKTDPAATATSTLSCNYASSSTCIDYVGSDYVGSESSLQSTCTSGGGTFSTSACTTSGRIGSCDVNSGSATETITRYYTAYSGGASAAQSACTGSSGTWTAN